VEGGKKKMQVCRSLSAFLRSTIGNRGTRKKLKHMTDRLGKKGWENGKPYWVAETGKGEEGKGPAKREHLGVVREIKSAP